MCTGLIAATDRYARARVGVLDSEIAYADTGKGEPIVFLHGNPTSSYLWRNVIPHVENVGRCLAPDLMGMGDSGKIPEHSYRFMDHARYLDAWFDTLGLTHDVTLVVHDWGSALGFHWARRHPERLKAIVYMEAIVQPLRWEMWPEHARTLFQALRSPEGERLVLEENIFIERLLPGSLMRSLTEEELTAYRRPYLEPGEVRRPMLAWPREVPFEGEPGDVHDIVAHYAAWLVTSLIPKLFINADPGAILTGTQRELCRTWPCQQEITVRGRHFIQEDAPAEIGRAIAAFLQSLSD